LEQVDDAGQTQHRRRTRSSAFALRRLSSAYRIFEARRRSAEGEGISLYARIEEFDRELSIPRGRTLPHQLIESLLFQLTIAAFIDIALTIGPWYGR
jgi:hypothetical protein